MPLLAQWNAANRVTNLPRKSGRINWVAVLKTELFFG